MTLEDLELEDEKLVMAYAHGQVDLDEFRERSDQLALLAACVLERTIGRNDE